LARPVYSSDSVIQNFRDAKFHDVITDVIKVWIKLGEQCVKILACLY